MAGVIFWPKWSFCNLALLRIFLHRKTNFSTISFYLNLQINNFFLRTTLMYIPVFSLIQINDISSSVKNMFSGNNTFNPLRRKNIMNRKWVGYDSRGNIFPCANVMYISKFLPVREDSGEIFQLWILFKGFRKDTNIRC